MSKTQTAGGIAVSARGMLRTDAVASLARARGDMLSLVTMQAVHPWNALGQGDSRNFNVLGCMGSASSVALGLALARPQDRILVIDGDGSLLMQLGSLVSIAEHAPIGIYHVVMENGVYETSGSQSVPGRRTADLCQIAVACGYRRAVRFDSCDELDRELPALLHEPGPVLISLSISGPGVVDDSQGLVAQVPGKPAQIERMRLALAGDPSENGAGPSAADGNTAADRIGG